MKNELAHIQPLSDITRARSAESIPKNSKNSATRRVGPSDSIETVPIIRGVSAENMPRGTHIKVEDWHKNPLSGTKSLTLPSSTTHPHQQHRYSQSQVSTSRPNDFDWPVY